MQGFTRLGLRVSGKAVGVVAGAGAAAANAPPVHARAPVQVRSPLPHQASASAGKIDDEWACVHPGGEVILFRPFSNDEVDEAANDLLHQFAPPVANSRIVIEDVDDGASISSVVSDGTAATEAIINADCCTPASCSSPQEQLNDLVALASKLLKSPGMQKEVFRLSLEDPGVRETLLRFGCHDLDAYLASAGLATAGLLPPAGEQLQLEPQAAAAADQEEEDEPDVVTKVVQAIAGGLEKAGSALASMGSWLRDRLATATGQAPPSSTTTTSGAEPAGAKSGVAGGRKASQGTERVLGGVMVLVVAMFFMLIARRVLSRR